MIATTITTIVVMVVVTMSPRRLSRIIIKVPRATSTRMLIGWGGRSDRYNRHNAKLTLVAMRRAAPAEKLCVLVSRNTNAVATAAHMPPSRSSSRVMEEGNIDDVI